MGPNRCAASRLFLHSCFYSLLSPVFSALILLFRIPSTLRGSTPAVAFENSFCLSIGAEGGRLRQMSGLTTACLERRGRGRRWADASVQLHVTTETADLLQGRNFHSIPNVPFKRRRQTRRNCNLEAGTLWDPWQEKCLFCVFLWFINNDISLGEKSHFAANHH